MTEHPHPDHPDLDHPQPATTELEHLDSRTDTRIAPELRVGPASLVPRGWRRWGLVGLGIAALALASSCDAHVDGDTLRVTGLAGGETIALRLAPDDSTTLQVDWNADGTAEYAFARSSFTRIVVDGAGGDDTIVIDQANGAFTQTELTTLVGGDGNDTLVGGAGAERLLGGAGADVLDGNQGIDAIDGGSGADEVRWEPGDGDDNVVGGADTDRFVLDGSAGNEIYSVGAVGRHARVTRDISNVALDLDGVEVLDLATADGADIVQVNDLAPTDLTTVDLDIAGAGGAEDGLADEVWVPAGVTLGDDGGAGTIDGLGARVRVAGGTIGDRIHVAATEAPDELVSIKGTGGADQVNVTAAGPDVAVDGATHGPLVILSGVDRIDTDLLGGDDRFTSTGNVAPLTTLDVDGGPGADTLLGGNGADVLNGGDGRDFIDGQQGVDAVQGGAHDDVVQWDPGDGNEVIDGGAGSDRMLFNGSATNEIFGFSAIGDHVRFTRNIASIVLDLDGVESFDLNALGGADIVQVDSVAGTDLATITPNLGGFGGVDDAAVDEVLVPPGKVIRRDGAAAVVDGMGARVQVVGGAETDRIHVTGTIDPDVVPLPGTSGADAVNVVANGTDVAVFGATPGVHVLLTAIDVLDVDLGAGNDTFSSTGNVAPLVALDVDGGPGADTLLGGNGNDALKGGDDADFLDGQQGIDGIDGGAGDDVIQWDPGDGNDSMFGGAGTDRLAFNGSATNEVFTVSRVNDQVRFTRNIASIVLNLDAVERLDVNAVGGTDVLQVDDLAGTDLTTVTANLGTFGTTNPDGAVDQVIVNGTAGADQIALSAVGTTVEANGLAAVVRITGADPTLDRLTVNGLEGDDGITTAPAVHGLIVVETNP